ncbi:MAG: rod shape-determining protein MreC [candidate division Zixibacteria bacterium]|jgi:rod shape-determining protein MreC|nr:rod shape-determining protein MreC [candidate division Zixibacteria bacterium]
MNWISNLFFRYWRNVHFSAVVVVSILLILNFPPVNGLISQAVIGSFYYPFAKLKNLVVRLSTVDRENERLRQALVDASVRLSRLEEAERENLRLRAVLGFEPPTGYSLLPAQVLSVSGGRVPTSAIINRGYRDSVYVNQPVINQEGLIGRINSVSPDFATVQLLTDPVNRVAVRVADSRAMGIAKFSPRGMVLDNFPIQGDIGPGRPILSSGLGGIYPAGLLVGYVTEVERPAEAAFCDVTIEPAANFNSLEELFLLRPGGS